MVLSKYFASRGGVGAYFLLALLVIGLESIVGFESMTGLESCYVFFMLGACINLGFFMYIRSSSYELVSF